jgi:predicted permease
MLQDLRFGVRMLGRSPGFAFLAVACLSLGIGANAAAVSWIEGILLRPFPAVVAQDRLLAVSGTTRGSAGSSDLSWPDFVDFERQCTLIDLIEDKITGSTLSIGDRAERASGSIVGWNYFDLLGVHPVLGRGFESDEGSGRNAHPVTVISYRFWKERFSGDPAIIGKTQRLNAVPHTIVGVAPEGFYGTFVGYQFQFWVPTSMQEVFDPGGYKLEDRGARWIEGFARLKPGVTLAQAQAEISAVAARLETEHPDTNRGRGIRLLPLWQTPFNKASELLSTLSITLAMVLGVLLIACANVSNLLLVRSLARRQEMTVRLALGSGRGRLVRQLLTEGLILSTLGAAGGLAVAFWCRNLLVLFFPSTPGVVFNLPAEVDGRVLAFSAAVCLVSTLLCALVPAIQSSRIDLAGALKSGAKSVVGSHSRSWLRSSLVLIQVSLSFVLLAGAGLLVESLQRMRTADPGFTTSVETTGIDLVSAGYDATRAKAFQDDLVDRLQVIAGIRSAAFARIRPFSYLPFSSAPIAVDGYQPPPDTQPTADYNEVGPTYFEAMGIPIVSGREFTRFDNETSAPVAVVNETMADVYWRGQDPLGKRLQVKGRWMQVVGVARASKSQTFLETPKPFFYVPLRQNFSMRAVLHLRTSLDSGALTAVLAREIRALDANLATSEIIPMSEQVYRKTSPQRIAVTLLGLLGALALVLAAIGLYGVMSSAVSQGTRELALRIALGAGTPDLWRLVMSRGLILTACGVALGAAAALMLTRLMGYLLYEVSPRDPLVFGSAGAVMMTAGLIACAMPAWRAMRTDPLQALRD